MVMSSMPAPSFRLNPAGVQNTTPLADHAGAASFLAAVHSSHNIGRLPDLARRGARWRIAQLLRGLRRPALRPRGAKGFHLGADGSNFWWWSGYLPVRWFRSRVHKGPSAICHQRRCGSLDLSVGSFMIVTCPVRRLAVAFTIFKRVNHASPRPKQTLPCLRRGHRSRTAISGATSVWRATHPQPQALLGRHLFSQLQPHPRASAAICRRPETLG